MQGKISVIVVDDHSLVLESIAALLQSSATIVHTSNSTDVALKICKAYKAKIHQRAIPTFYIDRAYRKMG